MGTAKVRISVIESDSTDLSSPRRHDFESADITTTECIIKQKIDATAAGAPVDLGNHTTIKYMVIENFGAITVTVRDDTLSGGSADIDREIVSGEAIVLTDVDPAGDLSLTSASATSVCYLTIIATG